MSERITHRSPSLDKESEPLPKVVLVFQGTHHMPLNLQGVAEFAHTVDQYFARANGIKTLFLEDAEGFQEKVTRKKKLLRDHDNFLYWDTRAILSKQSQHPLREKDVYERIQQIETTELSEIINRHLLPIEDLAGYYMAREIELARKQYGVRIEWEVLPQGVHLRQNKLMDQINNQSMIFNRAWAQGDFDYALEEYIKTYRASLELGDIRDSVTIRSERQRIEQQVKSKDGGRTIYSIGALHYPLPFAIAKQLGPKAPLTVISNHQQQLASPLLKTGMEIRSGIQNPESYAQAMIQSSMFDAVETGARKRGLLAEFAVSFETVHDQVGMVASSIPIADIRRICETGQNIPSVLTDNSLAPDVQKFIR